MALKYQWADCEAHRMELTRAILFPSPAPPAWLLSPLPASVPAPHGGLGITASGVKTRLNFAPDGCCAE